MKPRTRQQRTGIAASPGVAVGRAILFDREHLHVPHRHVYEDEVAHEVQRLQQAIESSRRELEVLSEKLGEGEHSVLLGAQLMMHRDEMLIDGAIAALRDQLINAEWALSQTIRRLSAKLQAMPDAYLRERANDIEHVGERILRCLTGRESRLPSLSGDTVLVANDLGPSDAAQLLQTPAAGIVIELGSASSHTAILARALEIPAVVGVSGLISMVGEGDTMIVDALHGIVVLDPEPPEQEAAYQRAERFRRFTRNLKERAGRTAESRDGVRLRLDANVELPAEAGFAVQQGADGIGLYRTEFLYLDRREPPSEEEQTDVYQEVARVMSPRPVILRTFDLGGDRLHGQRGFGDSINPALGLRALRLALARPDLLLTQLRAAIRARQAGDVRIMFPLVTSLEELRQAKDLVEQARLDVEREGEHVSSIPVGTMIEVPSAALMAAELAAECDFFSVGTNDLVQYTLAIDRGNPRVAHLASPLHPAVLRLLDTVARAATKAGIEFNMCGSMAADPLALPVVLGLGYERVSTSVAYLPLIREAMGRIDLSEARELAGEALACPTTDRVRELVIERFRDDLGELWREQGLEL